MKKTLAILLASITFCSYALADVLDQVNAPASISDTFSSNTGKTVIQIDARVYVPDAVQMYCIPVDSATLEDEVTQQVYQLMWPDAALPSMESDDENVTISVEGKGTFKGYGKHTASLDGWGKNEYRGVHYRQSQMPDRAGYYNVALNTEWRIDKSIIFDSYLIQREAPENGISGHALTTEQAIEAADAFVAQLVGDTYSCYLAGETNGRYYDGQNKGSAYTSVDETSYVLVYTRVIDGVPLLPASYQTMMAGYRSDLYIPPIGYDQMFVTLDRQGRISNFYWSCPSTVQEGRIPQELLPFEKIMNIAEKMLPLCYQSEEVQDEQCFLVSRISLGYMALLQRDRLSFALTPVWVFYGDCEPKQAYQSYRPLLTLNAVDGTVVDLKYGY